MYPPRGIFTPIFVFLFRLGSALHVRRSVAFYNPSANYGSMLDSAGNGLGEPLNVIISGLSSEDVLTDDGIVNYARAIGFSTECFGIHAGDPQSANLGDGNGWVEQTVELREDYGDANFGTCYESGVGGNHFRVFRQNGPSADSKALFLAVSKEQPITDRHDIVPDGYNVGSDLLAAGAVGQTSYGGISYSTTAQSITGLLTAGSTGINHGVSQDGIVTLLTVTII